MKTGSGEEEDEKSGEVAEQSKPSDEAKTEDPETKKDDSTNKGNAQHGQSVFITSRRKLVGLYK